MPHGYRCTLADGDATRERPLTTYHPTMKAAEDWAAEVLKKSPEGSGVNVYQLVEQHVKMIPKSRKTEETR